MNRSAFIDRSGSNRSGGQSRGLPRDHSRPATRTTLPSPLRSFLDPRRHSLPRGTLLVLGSLVAALRLSHFPHLQTNLWILVAVGAVILGTLDTARCMRKRWDFYHGGVLLSVYMDLLVLILIVFLLLYPALS